MYNLRVNACTTPLVGVPLLIPELCIIKHSLLTRQSQKGTMRSPFFAIGEAGQMVAGRMLGTQAVWRVMQH